MSACMCDFALLNCSFFCWWFFKSTYILRILILYIWCKYFFPLYRSPFHFVCWVSTKSWKPKVGFSEVATMAFLYVVFHFRSLQPKSTYYSIFSCGTYMVTFFTLKPVIHLDFTAVSGWVLTPSEPPGLAPSWWLPACGRQDDGVAGSRESCHSGAAHWRSGDRQVLSSNRVGFCSSMTPHSPILTVLTYGNPGTLGGSKACAGGCIWVLLLTWAVGSFMAGSKLYDLAKPHLWNMGKWICIWHPGALHCVFTRWFLPLLHCPASDLAPFSGFLLPSLYAHQPCSGPCI